MLDWLYNIDTQLSSYALKGEENYVTLRVWTNSGASQVNLTDLIDMCKNLRAEYQTTNSENGDIQRVRDAIVYLYALVVNSERIV